MIGLLDCNNFFVSCERLFRPDLARKPVAVLSSNDGCIVARSQEVKDIGIPMGIPYFKVRDTCEKEGVVLFSGNITLYRDISVRVMHTLERLVQHHEMYSIDEAFFTLDTQHPEEHALHVRSVIMREIGIPVSIGVADTKTIAKYASEKVKKEQIQSGVCVLETSTWHAESQSVSCGTIWGIGRQASAKLSKLGIDTVGAFLQADRNFIRSEFGVMGERLYYELSGTPARTGREDETRKSIMSSRSFAHETKDLAVLESSVAYHVSHIAKKLRERDCLASVLCVSIRPNRFGDYALRNSSTEAVLQVPTNDTQILTKAALALVRTVYDPEVPYKKAGVTVGGIMPVHYQSGQLFHEVSSGGSPEPLDSIADRINAKYGNNTLYRGVIQKRADWSARATLKSPEYTTKWGEIVKIKAT